jgi:hypothetical protein
MHHLFRTPHVFPTRMDLDIKTLVVIMTVQCDAVPGKPAGDKAVNGLVSRLSGRECSGGNSRAWHLRVSS